MTLAASLLGGRGSRSARLTAGPAQAFGFQLVLVNPPQPVPTLSGVVVLGGSSGGADVALAAGPSPSSPIPPAVGILVEAESNVWTATQGQESATLVTQTQACTGPAITGVTCQEATFSNAGLAITASDPIAGGATGSKAVSFPSGGLVGVSLTVDCALTTLCGPPPNPGPPQFFFAADDGVHGVELWGTDGTSAGTVMIKDIHPTASSNPNGFTSFNGYTYFAANDGTNGIELWRTDGTAAGTTMVVDIQPGSGSGGAAELTVVGAELFFIATGSQLWKTDGTAAGTVMVTDPAAVYSVASPHELNGALYFIGRTVTDGFELWRSDGSPAGTVLVKDVNPGAGFGLYCSGGFTEFNGELYFAANDGSTGCELWKTAGTEPSTVLVKDIAPGSTGSAPFNLTVAGSSLFFSATDPATGLELWKTDGMANGTVLVKDITPGGSGSGLAYFAELSSRLYFSCLYPAGPMLPAGSLCTSDGTDLGTKFLGTPGVPSNTKNLTSALGVVFFQATGGPSGGTAGAGPELWKSDGTDVGTAQVKDINPGGGGSFPDRFTLVNNTVVFRASTDATGSELWVTNGTGAGTTLLKDILPGPGSGLPPGF